MYNQGDYYEAEYDEFAPQDSYDDYNAQNNYYPANAIPEAVKRYLFII